MEVGKQESSTKKDRSMVSPRLSFSHDVPQAQLLFSSSSSRDSPVITDDDDVDFDFSTSLEASMQEPCSADELFSDGKILPLSLKPKSQPLPTTTTTAAKTNAKQLKEIIDEEEEDRQKKEIERKPFWMFGRSGSVGSNRTTMVTTTTSTKQKTNNHNICLFRRSRSTGSTAVKTRSKNYTSCNYKNSTLRPAESSSKIYYYSGIKSWSHGDGVRIGPVINLPRGGSTASYRSSSSNSSSNNNSNSNSNNNNNNNSSIFGYLLCKCSTKGMEMEMERRGVTCSP